MVRLGTEFSEQLMREPGQRVIIAGSRDGFSQSYVTSKMDFLTKSEGLSIMEAVSGGARGVDHYGEVWAKMRGFSVKVFPAHWDKYGAAAGMIRNREMGDYADYLIAFWDGRSAGTKAMIDYMRSKNKHGKVFLL